MADRGLEGALALGGQPGQVFARQPALRLQRGLAGVGQALGQALQQLGGHLGGLVPVQQRLDLQVDQEIHVLAQGRGAVGVDLQRHAHVRARAGAELRAGQQAVDHAAQGQRVVAPGQAAHDVPVAGHGGGVGLGHLRRVHGQELARLLQAVGADARVGHEGAVGRAALQEQGRAAVGGDHALFHQLLGEQFLVGLDGVDPLVVVEYPAELAALLHHQPVGLAVAAQGAKYLVQGLQRGGVAHEVVGVPVEVAIHPVVGQLGPGAHCGLDELEIAHLAAVTDGDLAHQCRAVAALGQGAGILGQLLRHHGQHVAVEVHGGAPGRDILVQGAVLGDVGGGVGDGHEQGPAVAADLGVQGVVYVLGLHGIDGDELQVGEIPPPLLFHGPAIGQQLLHLFPAGVAPLGGQRVFRHAVQVFDTRRLLVADDGQHLGLGLAVANRVAQDRAAQVVALLDAVAGMGRYEQPAVELRQVGLDEHGLALAYAAPGELPQRAVDEFLDIGDGLVVLGGTDADFYAVVGKYLEHFIRGDKNLAAIVQHREAVAALGALDDGFGPLFFGLYLGFEVAKLGQGILVEHEGSYL